MELPDLAKPISLIELEAKSINSLTKLKLD